jgi:capsular polysaccharide biosynthesis protein
MNNPEKNSNDYYVVDLLHILRTLWHRAWIIVLTGLIAAAIGFCTAAYLITPKYSSSVMLYVNNSSFTVGDIGFSISSSEISAAQSLVKTYTVLLKNRTTLEEIIKTTGVDYEWKELYDMIEAAPVNETEIMGVTVTCEDPYEAEKIANGIAKILPRRISEVVEGSSMEVVDSAIAVKEKVAPSITGFTAIGFVLGTALSCMFMVVLALIDNTVHDEEYIINTYNYPILAKIPDLLETPTKRYGYYHRYYYKKH